MASFLALDENGSRSRCQSLRTWLFDVVRFTSERGRERLRVSVDKCKLTSLQVELLGGAVLLSQPLLRSDVETHSGVRAFWASSTFLAWIEQAGGEDPEPRLVLRSFVQEFGLSLAESCVAASAGMPWMQQPALSLLRAWLYWHPYLGLRETEHGRLRMWVEEGFGFDGSCQRGRLTAEEEEQLAAEVCAVDFWQRGGDVTRALWAAASTRQGPAAELALLRCRALLAAHGLKVQNSTGEELTTSRVQLRLQQVAVGRLGAEPGLTRQNGSASAAPDEEKLEPNKDATKEIVQPESHVIGDDEEDRSREMMLLQHEEEAIELARSIAKSAALPSPLAMDQTKVKDLDRIFDCIGRLQASADLDILFLALEKIMSHFCVSLAELEEAEYSMVRPAYFTAAVRCARSAALLLDKAAQKSEALEVASKSPLLLGVRHANDQSGTFLRPACEHFLFASMLLVASLAPGVLAGSLSRDWCPLLHGLLSLNLKILSLNLLASDNQKEPARGGSLLVQRGTAACLPRQKLWLRLCRLYCTSHDLALELTEQFLRRTAETGDEAGQLSWESLKGCIGHLFGTANSLTLKRISASEDSLLSMPHILLSGALRTGGPTIRAWRERCRTWQAEVPETDAPTAWKVSFRALRKEETAASNCHQDDKEDIETCRVVARCLSSSWSLPDIDPEEPRSACKRDGPFKRMLNSNMAYSILGAGRKSGEHRDFQSQADLHFADSRVVKNGSEVPPHILGLAMAVNQRLDPSSTSSLRFLKAVSSQLDVQLFNASLDSFQPQALLHPFTFNACCMMNMLQTELLPEQCSKPFDDMINAVASINKLSDSVEAIPADALKAKFGKEPSQAAADLLKKREEFHQLVLEVSPSRRHTAKMPRSETLTQMDKPEVSEMKKAMEMLEPASKVPAVTSLPFENPYSMLLKLSLAERVQGQKPELLEALMCISKALAIGPACQELWWSAAKVFLQIFLQQDDADSLVEPWSQKLQVLAGSSDTKSSPCWRFLYGQARMLNQVWQCRLTRDLNSGLQKTLKAGHRQIPAELSHLALQWFERQLEMLVLLRCRRRYFARNNESRLVSHLNRCKRTAQTLLWFLIKCTDMSGEFHYTADVMATVKEWDKPVFAETWCRLANGGSQPLLCFRGMDGRDRVPATYLWYVPYILGRIEWKLSKLCPASPERLERKSIICLLMDACHVELAVRASLTERRRDEIMETEPSFRLHAVRLAILFGSPDGYESAGTICFDTNCLELSRQNVIVDALKGMQAVVQENKCHMGKYLSCEARALLDSGELNRAADCVIKIVDEAMRARKFRVPSFGACLNPHVMLYQRARKAERQQWAAMQTCLEVQQAILQAILGVQAYAALQEKPDDLRGFESCSGVHPGHRTKVVNALKSLDQNRPESWQALFQVKYALLRMVFACIDTESNTSFELSQTVYLLRAIRRSFNALVKANSPGGRSNAPSRPYLDWRLFSLLRHLCLRCRVMRRFLDDPKLCQEVELLQASLKAAAWRLFCFGLGTGEPSRSSTSDEDFFESLQGQMPQTKELKDLIGVAIDGEELDA